MTRQHVYGIVGLLLFILLVCLVSGCDKGGGGGGARPNEGRTGNQYITNDLELDIVTDAARNNQRQLDQRDHFRENAAQFGR